MVLFHSFCTGYISSASSSNMSSLDRLATTCTQDIAAVMTLNFCLWCKANTEKLSEVSQLSIRLEIKVKNMSSEEVIIQPVRLFPHVNWMPFTTGAYLSKETEIITGKAPCVIYKDNLRLISSLLLTSVTTMHTKLAFLNVASYMNSRQKQRYAEL